jgi:glucokinase
VSDVFAIGIDVGGTKIAGGLVNTATGDVYYPLEAMTQPEDGGGAVFERVLSMVLDLLDAGKAVDQIPMAIGIGIAELVDQEGRVASSHIIDWAEVPYAERLKAVLPTVVDSDIRTAALAEAQFGSGNALSSFAYVSVGTGIGGCLVIDGAPIVGVHGNAMILGSGALSTTCDACGHALAPVLEQISSGPGIVSAYREAGAEADRCEEVFVRAKAGEQRACDVLQHAGRTLGVSVAFMVNLLDPEAVLVGGGVGLAGGLYWEAFVASVREHVWAESTRNVPIRQSSIGTSAALIGAALKSRLSQ